MNWKIFYETKKGIYEVSDEGQVRNTKTNYIYKLSKNTIGYHTVKINKKWFLVHRLVAKYFIGEIEDKKISDSLSEPPFDVEFFSKFRDL